jgi:hypothetical protein
MSHYYDPADSFGMRLRGPVEIVAPRATTSGWQCPHCGKAHAPHVRTCPEPTKLMSLKERLKRGGAFNG